MLTHAIRNNEYDCARVLIEAGVKGAKEILDNELLMAAKKAHLWKLDELIKLGEDVNLRDDDGVPAVIHAAKKGDWLFVHKLINYGADLQEVESQAEIITCTDVVKQCYFGYLHEKLNSQVKFTWHDEEMTVALRLAINMGDLDTAAKLEREGADVIGVKKVANIGRAALIIKDLSFLVHESQN